MVKKNSLDSLSDGVIAIAQGIGGIIEKNLRRIRPEINLLIKNKTRDIKTIETYLDLLLDYASHGKGIEEFRKLNNYYESISPENAAIYQKFYEEAIKED